MPANPRIYLDHAATTPVVPAAREAMANAIDRWANPSSPHAEGRAARAALEEARRRIAAALQWEGELILTSGATEAINIGLGHLRSIATTVEHHAVLAVAVADEHLPVDENGLVMLQSRPSGTRYAVQHVSNETGVIQPMDELSRSIHGANGTLFADCSQSAGKLALPDADLIAVSAHKLGGPPGIGALLVRELGLMRPTGGQERGYRRGTENLPAALGFAAALEAGFDWVGEAERLRDLLDRAVEEAGGKVVARHAPRLATIASYWMPGVSASSQLIAFDMAGFAVSAGSACSSGTLKASHVLAAMGWDDRAASEVIRVSFGRDTSEDDIIRFIEVWRSVMDRTKRP